MVTYREKRFLSKLTETNVYLEGKRVGTIKQQKRYPFYFAYYPKGSKVGGAFFRILEECKKSIEGS